VPKGYEENTVLANWVSNQRQEYKKYKKGDKCPMREERVAKLEKVGFAWSRDAKQAPRLSWDDKYVSSLERERDNQLNSTRITLTLFPSPLQDALLAYSRQHGDCNVPYWYNDNASLGRWASAQRQEYKKYKMGSKNSMTEEKIAKLEK